MSLFARERWRMWLAAALILVAASAARAQDEGPIVIGQRRQAERFHLDRPNLSLELESIYSRGHNQNTQGTVDSSELTFTETLRLETQGYILNPNFIDLNLKGDFGLSQTSLEVNDQSATQNNTIYTWDLSSTYRRESNAPFTVYSQREQSYLSVEFGQTLDTWSMNTGAILDLRTGFLPSRFEVARQENQQTGLATGDLDFHLTRDFFNWQARATPGTNQTLTWNYEYSHVNQTGQTSADFDTHNATLIHEYLFGYNTQSSLTSTIDYNYQSDDPYLQHLRWDERVIWRHSDTLETRYRYTYDQTNVEANDHTANGAQVGFTHKLYQSLITRGNATYAHVEESGGFTSNNLALDLRFDYTKHVPYGLLLADLTLFYGVQDQSARGTTGNIVDLPLRFNDPAPIVLVGNNINPGSIVLTDPSGIFFYTEGVDYTVHPFADRVEIDRIVGGRIPGNGAVLADYTLGASAANTTTTQDLSMGLRYDIQEGWLNGLSFYGRFTVQDQSISATDPSQFVLNDFTDYMAGVQYRRGPWLATAEYQVHDSTVVPFTATRFWVQYNREYGAWTTTGNAAYTILDYTDENNEVDLLTLSLQARYRFTRRLEGVLTFLYHDQTSTLAGGNSRGIEEQLELRWWYRQTRVYARLRNAQLDTDTVNNDFQFFQVGIRRDF